MNLGGFIDTFKDAIARRVDTSVVEGAETLEPGVGPNDQPEDGWARTKMPS